MLRFGCRVLLVSLFALAGTTSSAGAAGLELADGAGFASIGDRGVLRGTVRMGRIVVTRRNYGAAPAADSYVRGCEHRSGRLRTRLVCRGSYLRFYLHGGRWLVATRGRGINVRGFARGRLTLDDGRAGTYSVKQKPRLPWPAERKVVLLPSGASARWANILDDQFDSRGIPSHWQTYDGRYSSSGNCATPAHVSVSGGYLQLLMRHETTGRCGAGWYTGGLALRSQSPYSAINQRITVRWRVVNMGVVSHRIVPMRWPVDASRWPASGEEDFCESHSNSTCSTFLHYGSGRIDRAYSLDLTQWHTMRFERRSYVVKAYIDDMARPVWTYRGNPTTLPDTKKVTVLQQECPPARAGGCPSGTDGSEKIQIDWIRVDNAM